LVSREQNKKEVRDEHVNLSFFLSLKMIRVLEMGDEIRNSFPRSTSTLESDGKTKVIGDYGFKTTKKSINFWEVPFHNSTLS
jgi:hypothetical protein